MLHVIIDKRNARVHFVRHKKIYCNSVSIYLCICPVTDISASVTPIVRKVCPTVDLSFGYKVSAFGGDIFRCHQLRDQKWRGVGFRASESHLTANISQTVNRSLTCH